MKKKKGSLIIQVVVIGLCFILLLVCLFVFTRYKHSAESEIVSDSLTSSNLAAFSLKNLDLSLMAQDPSQNIVVIKDPNAALATFKRHLKYNLCLDDNFQSINSISFIKSEVKIDKFIIYNVNGNDVTEYDLNNSTGSFNSTFYPNGKGVITTPKGSTIQASTIHSQISFTIESFLNNYTDVSSSEDTDVLKN